MQNPQHPYFSRFSRYNNQTEEDQWELHDITIEFAEDVSAYMHDE